MSSVNGAFSGFNSYGKCLEKVIPTVRRMNAEGIAGSLSYLPIKHKNPRKITQTVKEYYRALNAIERKGLDCDVTLKPHQFGVYDDVGQCRVSILKIVERAHASGHFVWIDMERSATVDATIGLFESIFASYRNVGLCLQAYLRRTEGDLQRLLTKRVPIRLVKGFYREHHFSRWSDVTENFASLMRILLQNSDRPAIATHDLHLVRAAVDIIQESSLAHAEVQFFAGVRDELAIELARRGLRVRIYIPYGRVLAFLVRGLLSFDISRHLQRVLRLRRIR